MDTNRIDMPGRFRRRTLLRGMAGIPLATLLANPAMAAAVAGALEQVQIVTASGHKVSGYLARPETLPAPAVLIFHEWWGLNDQIKTVTAECARRGYLALAVDLYAGQVANDREQAAQLARAVETETGEDISASWINWLRERADCSGRIGTVGWCFGGGWSLRASTVAPVDATVVYYGRVNLPAERLARLQGPVLGHFATRDTFIDEAMVAEFAAAMNTAGQSYTVHWYEADHAFANPTGNRYDEDDAMRAWERTFVFLDRHLKR